MKRAHLLRHQTEYWFSEKIKLYISIYGWSSLLKLFDGFAFCSCRVDLLRFIRWFVHSFVSWLKRSNARETAHHSYTHNQLSGAKQKDRYLFTKMNGIAYIQSKTNA